MTVQSELEIAAARQTNPPDGVTDAMVDAAEKAWDATEEAFWKEHNYAPAGACDRSCMRAALTAALSAFELQAARAEADANRLAGALRGLLEPTGYLPDRRQDARTALAEHDKEKSK